MVVLGNIELIFTTSQAASKNDAWLKKDKKNSLCFYTRSEWISFLLKAGFERKNSKYDQTKLIRNVCLFKFAKQKPLCEIKAKILKAYSCSLLLCQAFRRLHGKHFKFRLKLSSLENFKADERKATIFPPVKLKTFKKLKSNCNFCFYKTQPIL